MKQQDFTPDRTMKNAMRVIRSRKNKTLILSCKYCFKGISPCGTRYRKAALALSVVLSLAITILIFVFSDEIRDLFRFTSNIELKRVIIICVLTVAYCYLILPVSILLTLQSSKWVPTERLNQSKDDS